MRGHQYSQDLLDKAQCGGRSTPEQRDAMLARITPTVKFEDLAGCVQVIEAVFEDRAIKADVTRHTEAKFGNDDPLSKTARAWEPWVNEVVTMRNAVDHPNDGPRGKLIVKNFHLDSTASSHAVVEPVWNLTGDPERKILGQMQSVIEGILRLGEDVLIVLFDRFRLQGPFAIYEIPEGERNLAMPKRLRIGLVNMQ